MFSPRRISAIALFSLALSACTGWTRLTDVQPRQPSAQQRVQVWSHGVPYLFHAIRLGPDTLSGIPITRDRNCGECRIAIPLADIDSLRGAGTVNPNSAVAGFVAGVGLGLLSLYLLLHSGGGT